MSDPAPLLLAAGSGLDGLWAQVRSFLVALSFARPGAFWLLLVFPVLLAVNWHAARLRARAVAAIGRPAAVAGLQTQPQHGSRWLGFVYPLAWVLLVIGLAGPRWGRSDEPGLTVGRDLVIVIDVSQSMLATDMSSPAAPARWQAARAAALELLDAVRQRAGHRVAVVAFAASPEVLCPLTTDYDHAQTVIERLDARRPPPECWVVPGGSPHTGTRLGLAVQAAVAELANPSFVGSQDVVLISDGDDPAPDRERDWVRGITAAQEAGIPVHTAGVGNPTVGSPILVDGVPLTEPGSDPEKPVEVRTRLHEFPLQRIAGETGGTYAEGRRTPPPLGELYRNVIVPRRNRELDPTLLPQPKDRAVWFLAASLGLFLIGWLRGR